jgi:putative transposase
VTYNFHMSDFKAHQNRKSLRLPNYEYTQEGAYFITILTVNRECLFGDVVQGEIRLNPIGNIVKDVWQSIPIHFPQASVDDFVIMPNHIHGIINLVGARHAVPLHYTKLNYEQFGKPISGSIPTIIRSFKSEVTRRVNILRHTPGAKLWQRNYYEHVIRNEKDFQALLEYIHLNPIKWGNDD